jgi:hypothetical protein
MEGVAGVGQKLQQSGHIRDCFLYLLPTSEILAKILVDEAVVVELSFSSALFLPGPLSLEL